MKTEDFLTYIKESKSKATLKNYTTGLKKFTEWYGKNGDTILKERFEDRQSNDLHKRKRFGREIEKFHRHLKNKGHSQNTAVAYTEGIRQLFRFFEMDIRDLPTEVTRKTTSIKDYVPTVQQYRDMFNCGNILDRTIISMSLDLGWRIGDFVKIKKEMLPNLNQETPIPFSILTEKEEIVSKSFLSGQTVHLLKSYMKTLPKENPYLFAMNGRHYDPEAIGKRLKVLSKKAKVHIPKGRRFRFHCFRKRVYSECANLKFPIHTACVLVGKAVPKDKAAYLSELDHKKAFEELHRKLQLTEVKAVANAKDAEIEKLKKELEEQKTVNKGLLKLLMMPESERHEKLSDLTITQAEAVVTDLGEEAERKLEENYKKLWEENNNNNH